MIPLNNSSIEIIAEGEINHNGDVALAKKLVDAAKSCGADTIKFQCFVADSFIAPGSSFLPIFIENELNVDEFREVRDHAATIGIPMISTAGDIDGLAMIVELDLPTIKVGSTNITNFPLLEAIAETGKPVYLSSGASTLGEIEAAVNIVSRNTQDITLFHCTVQYPAESKNLNLAAISTIAMAFPEFEIGYSDHTRDAIAAPMAVAFGATVIEKHFTLDHELPGPDHSFSMDPDEFTQYVQSIRFAEQMIGSGVKAPAAIEAGVRLNGRRYLTAFTDIAKGDVITSTNIRGRRIDVAKADPEKLLGAEMERRVIGASAARDLANGTALSLSDLVFNT